MSAISSGLFVRARRTGQRTFSHYGPLAEGHPLVGSCCFACGEAFRVGDVPALVALGPGDDAEARERWLADRYANVAAIALHLLCAGSPAEAPSE